MLWKQGAQPEHCSMPPSDVQEEEEEDDEGSDFAVDIDSAEEATPQKKKQKSALYLTYCYDLHNTLTNQTFSAILLGCSS